MQNIDWAKFLKLEYWLEGIAGGVSNTPVIERNSFFFWFFLYLFSTLLILGIIIRVAQAFIHTENPLQKKFPFWGNNLIWMGILGFTWFTLRQISVGFLGARFWLIFGGIWFLVILYMTLRYFFTFFPLEMSYFKKNVLKSK